MTEEGREPDGRAGQAGRGVFVAGSTMRHVVVMASTGSVGLMSIFAVDFLNLLYISMLGQAELAAAIGYAGTLLFAILSLSVGFAISATALVSRALGAGDRADARMKAGSSIVFVLVASLVLTAIFIPLLPGALTLLGARGETFAIALGFLRIVIPSFPVLALSVVISGLLRAVGDARRAMYVTLSGAAATAVLDPLLIFAAGLSVDGAAIASVAARLIMVAVGWHGLVVVHRMLARPAAAQMRADLRPFTAIAIPAILTQTATPVGNAFVTGFMAAHGDSAVAGWAVIGRLIPVAFAGVFALSGSVGPILGQNLGAGAHDRIRRALTDAVIVTTIYVAAVWLILWLAKDEIVHLFNATGEAADLIRFFCTWIAATFFFFGCLFVANAAFNTLGFATYATAFNWGRATLGTIPFVAIGSHYYGAGGVLIGQGLGSVVFGTLAIFVCFRAIERLRTRPPGTPMPPVWRFPLPPFTSGKGGTAG